MPPLYKIVGDTLQSNLIPLLKAADGKSEFILAELLKAIKGESHTTYKLMYNAQNNTYIDERTKIVFFVVGNLPKFIKDLIDNEFVTGVRAEIAAVTLDDEAPLASDLGNLIEPDPIK